MRSSPGSTPARNDGGSGCVATVAIAAILDAVLRGTFTDRGYLSVFTIVLFLFNCLTTFGWRLVWLSVARWRRTVPVS